MATIKQLQEAIDNNSLDPSTLSKEQYNAVEQLIEEGKIESKPLGQIQEERDNAALKIARVRQIEEDPIRAKRIAEGKTGSRATFELVGDIIGSVAPLIYFRKNILKAAKSGQLLNKQTTSMERMAATLPDKMRFTKGVATRLARAGGTVERIAKSPLVGYEAASIAGGTVGAGLGSATYDLTNEAVGDEIVAAMTEDLGEIPKKEIDQDITLNAMEAMKNAALWNTGAALLTPFIAGPLGKLGSYLFGAKGARAKELAQFAKDKGLPIPLMAAFKDGPLSDLGRNYYKTVGVFPFVSGTGRKAFENAEQIAGKAYLDNFLAYAPIVKTSALGESILQQMNKTFEKNYGVYAAGYKRFDAFVEGAGNPAIVSLDNSRKAAVDILDELNQSYPGIKAYLEAGDYKAISELTNQNDALFTFAKFLKATGESNIGVKQFKGAMEMLNRAMENSKLKSGRELVYRMREAMETDLAGMTQNLSKGALLNDKSFRATYDVTAGVTRNEAGEIVNIANEAAGETLIKSTIDSAQQSVDALLSANAAFSRIMSLYTKGGLADKFKRVDKNIFTQKALLGITGKSDISREAFYDTIEKNVFLSGDPSSLRTFKELVGAEDLVVNGKVISKASDDGKLAYNIAMNRYFFNTFFDSFDTSVTPGARSIFNDIADDSFVRNGAKYPEEVMKEAGQRGAYEGLSIQDVKKGVGQIDTTQIRFSPDDFAQFNINKFMNKLNIGEATSDLGRLKLRRMLGSQEHYDQFIRFTDYMKSISDIPLADTATFLQRRFTLGSLGSVAGGLLIGGASMAVSPFAPVIFIALAKQFGKVLADPVALRLLNDALSPAEREAIAATGKIAVGGEKFTAKSGIYRRIAPGVDAATIARAGFAKNRDAAARFLNYIFPETKDNPQLDLTKVEPQEIVDYLNNQPYEVPSDKGFQEKIPQKNIKETFPDQFIDDKNITQDEIAAGAQFYQAEKAAEVNTLDEITRDTAPTDEAISQDVQLVAPNAGSPGVTQQAANADLAQALFPRDELLNLAARRRNVQS